MMLRELLSFDVLRFLWLSLVSIGSIDVLKRFLGLSIECPVHLIQFGANCVHQWDAFLDDVLLHGGRVVELYCFAIVKEADHAQWDLDVTLELGHFCFLGRS